MGWLLFLEHVVCRLVWLLSWIVLSFHNLTLTSLSTVEHIVCQYTTSTQLRGIGSDMWTSMNHIVLISTSQSAIIQLMAFCDFGTVANCSCELGILHVWKLGARVDLRPGPANRLLPSLPLVHRNERSSNQLRLKLCQEVEFPSQCWLFRPGITVKQLIGNTNSSWFLIGTIYCRRIPITQGSTSAA